MTKKYKNLPDETGHFGKYGGVFAAETLIQPIEELAKAYKKIRKNGKFTPKFQKTFDDLLQNFVGRPSPIYFAERLTNEIGGAKIYFKREDLNHTGAHKINNAIGQVLLAKQMGKTRVIAETGAGQHGVATATVASRFGLQCVVYMGSDDIARQAPNVERMKLLGAQVRAVSTGSRTLKDALNEAMRDWVTNVDNTFYIIGTVAGPHPYPMMVRDFQAIIGIEAKAQFRKITKKLPDAIVACIGGGSNAIGIFHEFLDDKKVNLYGVEAGGLGIKTDKHAASLLCGSSGVLHGNRTYLLQNPDGQIIETHSISAGLDYPGVGPEHAYLYDRGRIKCFAINDDEALSAFSQTTRLEGIIPALESSHALAYAFKLAKSKPKKFNVLVNLSGRGDKDMNTVMKYLKI